jgi:hypothetical protein
MLDLFKIASRVASLHLEGPFREANENELANAVSFQVPGLELDNEEFKSPINISIRIDQYYEEPDSEVGFEGRNDIQEFVPVAINGMMLENQDDKNILHRAIYKFVMDRERKLVKAVNSKNGQQENW